MLNLSVCLLSLLKDKKSDGAKNKATTKVIMHRKLIAVVYCIHMETSSFWAEFVNKNRFISVRLVSEEVKSIKFW